MKQYKDNFKSMRADIARRVLSSALVPYIGYPGDVNRLDQLNAMVAEQGDLSTWSYLSVSFRKAGTGVDLSIDVDRADGDWKASVDAEGNEFHQYNLRIGINYPCHGACAPSTTLARANFISQVALLAAEIEAEFSGVALWHMTRSAAEIKEDADKQAERDRLAAEQQVTDKFVACVKAISTSMRVDGFRDIPVAYLEGLPTGVRNNISVNGKTFSVKKIEVAGNAPVGLITRTA